MALNTDLGELGAVLSPGEERPEQVIPTGVCCTVRAAPAGTPRVFQQGEPLSWDDLSTLVGERATSLIQPHSFHIPQGCGERVGPCPVLHVHAHQEVKAVLVPPSQEIFHP